MLTALITATGGSGSMFASRRNRGVVLQVAVSAEDIAEAVRGNPSRNPLALALVRQLNVSQARVSGKAATLIWNSPRRDVEVAALPLGARLFMTQFAASFPVYPFTFRLAVTAVEWQRVTDSPTDRGLPLDARAATRRIRELAQLLLDRAGEFPFGSKEAFIVRQILEKYLPETAAGYLALHEESRNQAIGSDGRTGRQVLMHELGLMEARLREIAAELDRQAAAALLRQEQFLENQLGEGRPEE